MNKTIEEAAREASVPYCSKFAAHQEPYEIAYTEFLNGAGHVMSMPLSQRLTDEGREKIKANYAGAKSIHIRCVGTMSKNHISDLHNEYDKGLNMGIMIALKRIFGKELFVEE